MNSSIVKHGKRTVRKGCDECGTRALYWAHDTAVAGDYCPECRTHGKWVLVDAETLLPHTLTCPGNHPTNESEPVVTETPVPAAVEPSPAPVAPAPSPSPSGGAPDAFAAFQTLMATLAPKVDRAEVEAMIKDQLDGVVFPTRVVVERATGERKELPATAHVRVADVITDLLAGEHVMMVGPAGTGKSTIAEQCADALGIAYYAISLSPMTPASQILGYMQAEGQYVRTLYREAYENGGVFHFDEVDNAHPSVLAVINASLANGAMAFPDGMVKRHADFRCVASANTYGKGADRAYVGRQQIDAATLDRFTIETIEIDETLERTLCLATGLDAENDGLGVDLVLDYVRKLRRNAETKRMTVVLSPRASVGMCRLLAAGKSWDAAVEARVRRGMSDADWGKLTA